MEKQFKMNKSRSVDVHLNFYYQPLIFILTSFFFDSLHLYSANLFNCIKCFHNTYCCHACAVMYEIIFHFSFLSFAFFSLDLTIIV